MDIAKKHFFPRIPRLSELSKPQKRTLLFFVLCFAVPVFLMLISFIRLGIRPFGDNSLLGMDLWSQYFPMLRHQYASRRELAMDLFSWDGAMGIDTFVQNAYYCNSPFNFLLLLSPLSLLIDALDYLILFKFGLAGLSFGLYCRRKFKKVDWFTVGVSSAYALCSYCLAFISQVMWFDAVVFFPLILLGFERLMEEKKPFFYCLILALTIYSGFYISFSICLFLIIYFLVYAAEHIKELRFKGIIFGGLRFSLFSLLAGGLAAFVLLPVYFGLQHTIASDIPAPSAPELYNSLFEYLANLFPATPVSLQYDVPNIYSGFFVLILLPLFLMNKKIALPRKILYSGLVVFLYFSMNLNYLDYAWHGFHFPNQLPGRWTFIFSFIVLIMCYELLRKLDGIPVGQILASALFVAAVFVLVLVIPEEKQLSTESIAMGVIFLLLYTVILVLFSKYHGDSFQKTAAILLAACMLVEVFSNSSIVLLSGTEVGDVNRYTNYDDEMAYFTETYADNEDDFYRSEMYYNWTFDHCQLFGIKGLTYYSSTMDGAAYDFYKGLGYRVYAKNVSTVYCPYSPMLNSVLNIRYLAGVSMQMAPDYLKKIDEKDSIEIMENEKVLPVMFPASEEILAWEPDGTVENYEEQNRFFAALTGIDEPIYKKIENRTIETDNATLSEGSVNWTSETYIRSRSDQPVNITYRYTLEEDGPVYLCHNYKKGDMTIQAAGKDVTLILYREPMKYLGEFQKGDVIEITVKTEGVSVGTSGLALYSFDRALFESCYDQITAMGSCEAQPTDSGVICEVTNQESSLLFTSIPARGMTCTVDGREAEMMTIDGYLAAIRVPAGKHTVEFSYETEGLSEGLLISGGSALVLAALGLTAFFRRKKTAARSENKNKEISQA